MRREFPSKNEARQAVWDEMVARRVAGFPFPPHGRIPNFTGARQASERLFEVRPWSRARRIKVNPDAPQRFVRLMALERGITVYMPTPRLRGGFKRLDPARIPARHRTEAVSLSKCDRWAEEIPLTRLPDLDAIVAGSVAVTRSGYRCGKGEGYSDLEYAILIELGHSPPPVATTVHSVQVVDSFPRDATDIPLSLICTPEEIIPVSEPPPAPRGIDWERLTPEDLERMPVLKELRRLVRRPPG